jgi:hypothetical protein
MCTLRSANRASSGGAKNPVDMRALSAPSTHGTFADVQIA